MNILLGYCQDHISPAFATAFLERSYRKKHNVFFCGTSWGAKAGFPPDVDLSEIVHHLPWEPDLFIFIERSGRRYWPKGLEKLPFPTVGYMIDVHRHLESRREMAGFFDYVFVAQKDYVEEFKKDGNENVFWLPLACDVERHKKYNCENIYDVAFVGSIRKGHEKRRYLLEKLSERYRMNDYHKYYPPEEMSCLYSQAKIVFNYPVNIELNMRVFEVLASGTLLVTQRIGNGQDELFKDGEHLVTYTDEQNLMEVVEYYLQHDAEREKIAQTGHELVTQKHTYDQRAEQILETVMQNRKAMSALIRHLKPTARHLAYMDVYSRLRMVDAVMDEFFQITRSSPLYLPAYLSAVKALARRAKSGWFRGK